MAVRKRVLTGTQFGHDWEVRLALGVLLAAVLIRFNRQAGWRPTEGLVTAALAAGFVGTLAWSGHGGATPGVRGAVHLTADVLHLIAAGTWIGGLLPLWLLLSSVQGTSGIAELSVARDTTLRFSTLGIAAVVTLIITGLLNTWVLVGSVSGLVKFGYGRLLLIKIAFFVILLGIAAINRMRLTPRLSQGDGVASLASIAALRRLKRNCLIETLLGLAILIIVGVLGTIAPGMDMPE